MTTTVTPVPHYDTVPQAEYVTARPGLEEAVLLELRQLREKEKHAILIVQVNRDGTWRIYKGHPTR
jgi:hypothetical protein